MSAGSNVDRYVQEATYIPSLASLRLGMTTDPISGGGNEPLKSLSSLAEIKVRNHIKIFLQNINLNEAGSKQDVHDALTRLEDLGFRLRDDVHDALVRIQTVELSGRPILFTQRWENVYSLLKRTYVLPHKDFSEDYAPGFWAASNILKRRIASGNNYNAVNLNGLTLVSLNKEGIDNQFIYDCPSVFDLLLLRFFPTEITQRELHDMHDRLLKRRAEQLKNDKDTVGVEERLSLAQTLFVTSTA